MIRFEKVSKELGGRKILDNVSYEIKPGEIFVIIGASGTGKSVSLKHMVRLFTPDSGRVFIGDDCISEATGKELQELRSRFGLLFQGAALLEWLNAGENVGLPLRWHTKMPDHDIDQLVREKLAIVGLEDAFDKHPSDMSGGMQKRVGLARAIISNPKVVLYDEPTSGLDPVTARIIDQLIVDMSRKLGLTSVVVTHDMQSALTIADRIAMLGKGHIAELATPAEIIQSKVPEVQEFLEANFITKQGVWETSS